MEDGSKIEKNQSSKDSKRRLSYGIRIRESKKKKKTESENESSGVSSFESESESESESGHDKPVSTAMESSEEMENTDDEEDKYSNSNFLEETFVQSTDDEEEQYQRNLDDSLSSDDEDIDLLRKESNGSSQGNSSSQEEFDKSFSEPLYQGARLTKLESYLLILQFSMQNSLSQSVLDGMLKLIELHCPGDNHCATTEYEVKRPFCKHSQDIIIHEYCSSCHTFFSKNEQTCQNCEENRPRGREKRIVLEFDIQKEREKKFQEEKFTEAILYPHVREKQVIHISDIYDGSEYQNFEELQKPKIQKKN